MGTPIVPRCAWASSVMGSIPRDHGPQLEHSSADVKGGPFVWALGPRKGVPLYWVLLRAIDLLGSVGQGYLSIGVSSSVKREWRSQSYQPQTDFVWRAVAVIGPLRRPLYDGSID